MFFLAPSGPAWGLATGAGNGTQAGGVVPVDDPIAQRSDQAAPRRRRREARETTTMPILDSLQRVRSLALRVAAALAFLPPLLTRLVIGQAYHQTGSGKIAHFENVVAFFSSLSIPFPAANAFLVSRLEFWGGLLLVAGLATRFVAGSLAFSMVVALSTADRQGFLDALRGVGDTGLTDVVSFVFLLFLLWLVVVGPGTLSLDTLLVRGFERARAGKAGAGAGPPD
jgi:putative oxidoreductase